VRRQRELFTWPDDGRCLLCSKPRMLDPTKGGCECIGPTALELTEYDRRCEEYERPPLLLLVGYLLATLALGGGLLYAAAWVVSRFL